MRLVPLVRIALQAQLLNWSRHAQRVGFQIGMVAATTLFALSALAVLHLLAWSALQELLDPPFAAMAIFAFDLVIAAVVGFLTLRSAPGKIEQQALQVRDEANARLTIETMTAPPLAPARLMRVTAIRKTMSGALLAWFLTRR